MSQKTIRAILEGRLSTWAAARSPALPVAWENVPYAPTQGATYLRAYVLPADTIDETLAGGHRAYRGVFQVSIVCPIGTGPGVAAGIADELNTQFPVNGRYTSGAITVQVITPASAAPALQDESTFIVPVSIGYRCDTI